MKTGKHKSNSAADQLRLPAVMQRAVICAALSNWWSAHWEVE